MQNELNIVAIQADLTWENPTANLLSFEQKIFIGLGWIYELGLQF